MVSVATNLPFAIPHLNPNQKVKDWRICYTASTLLLKEEQRIAYLPIAVDRSSPEQKWANEATKKESLKEALDELELRLDGEKTRLQAMSDFFDFKPDAGTSQAQLSELFFSIWELGKAAKIQNDIIALKFLQCLPVGTKVFSENENKVTNDMSDNELISLFDAASKKLAMKPMETEEATTVMLTVEGDVMPAWAVELKKDVAALRVRLQVSSRDNSQSEEEADVVKTDLKQCKKKHRACSICGKTNHTELRCFKRVCTNCGGTGHDADRCTSLSKGSTNGNR